MTVFDRISTLLHRSNVWDAVAIIADRKNSADEKFAALKNATVKTVRSLADIGEALKEKAGW